jgi:hypothetical protein
METLDLSPESAPRANLKIGFRSGWLKHIGLVIGGASSAAVVLGAFQILSSQPDRAFALLQGWGPAFLIAMLAIVLLGKFLEGLVGVIRESFSSVAAGVQSSAAATGRTADALTRLADQGGKQGEEVRRLALYAAQEFPGIYERFDRQDAAMEKQVKLLSELASSVKELAAWGKNGN